MKMFAAILVAAAVVWLAPPGHPPQHHDSYAAALTADHSVNVDVADTAAPAEGPINYGLLDNHSGLVLVAVPWADPCESRSPDKPSVVAFHSYTLTPLTHNYGSDVNLASLRDRPEPLSKQPNDI